MSHTISRTYRGYGIIQQIDHQWAIKLNSKVVAIASTEAAAYDYIDALKREQSKA